MDFRFTEAEERFRQEVRDFIRTEMPQELRREGHAAAYSIEHLDIEKEWRRKLGRKGWLRLGWPAEYGGTPATMMERYGFAWEMAVHGAPMNSSAVSWVAPTLMRYGNDEQKKKFLGLIGSGEIDFALGLTEPNAGSDLASLQTRAEAKGDVYVINGQKIFTSLAHKAEYVWLAARTNPSVPKHKGISAFMVDLKTPGITIQPLMGLGGERTNATFWDNVVVPRENMVGEQDRGWYYITTSLDLERLSVAGVPGLVTTLERLEAYCKETAIDGRPLIEREAVRNALADLHVEVHAAVMLSHRTAWMLHRGKVPYYEASMLKVYSTELLQRMADVATQLLGMYGQVQAGSRHAPMDGRMEQLHRVAVMMTFGAGANEVNRNLMALQGLGLPRG